MTILFAWTNPLDPENGGIERVTSLLINSLTSRGHRCLYLECQENYSVFVHNNKIINDLKKFLLIEKVDVIINQNGYSDRFSQQIKRMEISTCYYVVFHNDPFMFAHLFSLERVRQEAFKGSGNVKVRVQWLLRFILFPFWRRHALNGIRKIFCTNYAQATKYVLLSAKFIDHFSKVSGIFDTSKLISIPNPLSFPTIFKESILTTKKKEVLIVSRLYEPEKRISYCLKIWKKIERLGFSEWRLIIIGHGPDENFYKRLAKKMGLQRVAFQGKQDSFPYYCRASIFMMTSRFEGWGLTLTESLQTGVVPIAMNSYPSLTDIIFHEHNGIIVRNNDLNTFAEKLQSLMENDDRRNQLAKNALRSAEKFSIQHISDQWENYLEMKNNFDLSN